MNKIIVAFLSLFIMTSFQQAGAQSNDTAVPQQIKLDQPQLDRGLPVMQAFKHRRSERQWADCPVTMRDLSDLLWAADGVNRPDGRRTAPSALGKNDIDIYALTPDGAYLYDSDSHALTLIATGDHRELAVGGQPGISVPPLALVMVSTPSRFGIPDPKASEAMGFIDAGIVSENIAIFCAGTGLATVPRYTMDRKGLAELLKLPEGTMLVLNNLVGYPIE